VHAAGGASIRVVAATHDVTPRTLHAARGAVVDLRDQAQRRAGEACASARFAIAILLNIQ
jgi:hypothetical protein